MTEFVSTVLQPSLPLTYYAVEPHSAEGKIRNRLTSCKSFSGRASELVTDLQSILDPSVPKSSCATARHTSTTDGQEEVSDDQAGEGNGEDDSFDQEEPSDHHFDDDGWESGSIHSENDEPLVGQSTTDTSSDSESEPESESGSTLHVNGQRHSDRNAKSIEKAKLDSILQDDDDDSSSDSNSDTLPSSSIQRNASKSSGGTGASTFLPSLSVGYIPGTGDSDPEDELEAVDGTTERKNRRGQRARRA